MGYNYGGGGYQAGSAPQRFSSFYTGQLRYPNRATRFVTFKQDMIHVPINQQRINILDDTETGELIGFYALMNNREVVLNVIATGDDNTQFAVCDMSATDLTRFGLGLAPGDVPLLPSGESADTSGVPNPVFPWVSRYKDEETADINGDLAKRFAIVYTPAQYPPYKKLAVSALNPSSNDCTIQTFRLVRIIYETLPSEYDKPQQEIAPGSV